MILYNVVDNGWGNALLADGAKYDKTKGSQMLAIPVY